MNRSTLIALCAALAVAALSSAAAAAPNAKRGLTGVWSGKTHQEVPPLEEGADFVTWSQRITVRALDGRLTYLGVSARYVCPSETNPLAGDTVVRLGWKPGQGPELTPGGGFRLNVTEGTVRSPGGTTGSVRLYAPLRISGVLGAGSAGGRFDLGTGDCAGKGKWQAKRKG